MTDKPEFRDTTSGQYPGKKADKPDALEELREVRLNVRAGDLNFVSGGIAKAIAAWEKERAEWRARHDRIHKELSDRAATQSALRAAVEKVRDELRRVGDGHPPRWARGNGITAAIKSWADALDAALGGGA